MHIVEAFYYEKRSSLWVMDFGLWSLFLLRTVKALKFQKHYVMHSIFRTNRKIFMEGTCVCVGVTLTVSHFCLILQWTQIPISELVGAQYSENDQAYESDGADTIKRLMCLWHRGYLFRAHRYTPIGWIFQVVLVRIDQEMDSRIWYCLQWGSMALPFYTENSFLKIFFSSFNLSNKQHQCIPTQCRWLKRDKN